MANRWRKVDTVTDFIFLVSKITADGDCSHSIKKTLTPWKKSYDKARQHIKKQRHHFADKVCIVKAVVFSAVMCRCESWTIKKAERQRTEVFELWCWRRLLRVPCTARRSKQSILKKSIQNIHWRADVEAEAPILSPPDEKSWHIEKDPDAGKRLRANEAGNRRWAGWMASSIQWTWVWANFGR